MTILFAGGEDTSFTLIGTAAGSTFGGGGIAGRSSFGRAGVKVPSPQSTADPPANRARTPTFTAGTIIWVHAVLSVPDNSTTNNEQVLIVRSPDGVSRILLRQTATAGLYKVSKRNAAGTITDLGTASTTLSLGVVHQLDMQIDYSGSGSVLLYFDTLLNMTFSGDPRTDAATQLNQVDLASPGVAFTITGGWSEVIVADEDTRTMSVWTLNPAATGNTQSWTPNTLANINKPVIDDATVIGTSLNDQLSEWTTPTTPPSGAWAVRAIVQEARVRVGFTGPQHFDWVLRTASTDYTAGASVAPTIGFNNFGNQIWATNPNTTGDWDIGDITTGFDLGIKSLA